MKRILKWGVFTLAAGGMILWLLWRLWPADPTTSQNQSQASYVDMHVHEKLVLIRTILSEPTKSRQRSI